MLQTIDSLARLTPLEVFVPNAVYPERLRPRSYRYAEPAPASGASAGYRAHYLRFGALPLIGRATNGYLAARALEAPLRRYAPDVVLAYWLYPDAYGASRVARLLGVPLVAGARGSDLRARDRLSLLFARRVLQRSNRVLTVSEDLRRIAVERCGVLPDRVRTIANGCDSRIFRPRDRSSAREVLGLPAHVQLTVFAGRLVAAKGVQELLTAWAAAAREQPHWHLALLGTGALREELAGSASAMGLSGRVWFPGAVPLEQVASWMQSCDVFCLPSHTEGYPNVLVEALACGRPVVSTPVGGVSEIVDASNGILTPVGDVAALTRALQAAHSRNWNETAIAMRFGRSWDDVALETLQACQAAYAEAPVSGRASTRDRC